MFRFGGDPGAADMFRFIEEKLGVGTWHSDVLSGQMHGSRGFYELLGLVPGTVAPSYDEIARSIHPEDRRLNRGAKDVLRAMLLDGLPLNREFRIIRPNGQLRWVHSQAELLLNADGEPARILGVVIDITDHRESLRQLRAGAERYNTLIRVVEGLVWTAGPDGRITSQQNWEAARQDGPLLISVNDWMDLLHEEDRDAALKKWSLSVETGRPYTVEYRLLHSDATYRWHRCRAIPILNLDGNVQEWLGVSTDVHNEKLFDLSASPSRLTGAQMRAARGILNWSVRQLADQTGVSPAVVRRLEECDGALPMSDELMEVLQKTFSDAGIELLFPQVGKPGVRPR